MIGKMKIIGHRGAAGLALENTLESIKKGLNSGADFIEFDIRQTHNGKIVLCHDADLLRTYGVDLKIKSSTLEELQEQCPKLPTLDDALRLLTGKGVIIELKEYIDPKKIFSIISKYSDIDIRFASFDHRAIRAIKNYNQESFCYVLEHHSLFEILNIASKMNASGVGLHYGIMNPATFLLAKYKKLEIYTYTLNKSWIAQLFKFVYRDVAVCTDYPNKLRHLKTK